MPSSPPSSRLTGEPEIGAWINFPVPFIAEAASRTGFDFVVLDMQHGLLGEDHVVSMVQAIELGGAEAAVRTRSAEAAHIGRMLDAGVQHLIVPMIETPGDVEAVVRRCRYAPEGERSFGPTRIGLQHENYLETGAPKISIYPMIETKQALENVESIAALDGVSGLFIGPADLSLSIGLKPARDHGEEVFKAAIDRIRTACGDSGIKTGIQSDNATMNKRLQQGFDFLTVAMDSEDLCNSFRDSFENAAAQAHSI